MKRTILLIVILALAACTIISEPAEPVINTDSIAGYWSGIVAGEFDNGQKIPQIEVGILIITGCTIDKVCGKFSKKNQCPGDLIFFEMDRNQYTFISETALGSRHTCGAGDIRMIDLELREDGTLNFIYHNGGRLTGILHRD